MKDKVAPNILLAIVLFAAVGTVALRAAARRPKPARVPGTRPAPVTVRAGEGQSPPAVARGTDDGAGHEMANFRPPAPRGRPVLTAEQAQQVFHELHAEGRNTHCAVCDSQYEPG